MNPYIASLAFLHKTIFAEYTEQELLYMAGAIWRVKEPSLQTKVTPAQFGLLLIDQWLRRRQVFAPVPRHGIIEALNGRASFVKACGTYSRLPEEFAGQLLSWFDDRYMAMTNCEDVYDTSIGTWIRAESRPKHCWVTILDLGPLYIVNMKRVQHALDTESAKASPEYPAG